MTTTEATALRTATSATGRVAVVAPAGDLGVDDCAGLREALRAAAAGAGLLVVDLLDVPSMEAAVVEVLVGASARCADQGVVMVVANAAAQPWKALTSAHVAGVLRAHRRSAPPLSELLELMQP
jgi:anti-anti-sigma factor